MKAVDNRHNIRIVFAMKAKMDVTAWPAFCEKLNEFIRRDGLGAVEVQTCQIEIGAQVRPKTTP